MLNIGDSFLFENTLNSKVNVEFRRVGMSAGSIVMGETNNNYVWQLLHWRDNSTLTWDG